MEGSPLHKHYSEVIKICVKSPVSQKTREEIKKRIDDSHIFSGIDCLGLPRQSPQRKKADYIWLNEPEIINGVEAEVMLLLQSWISAEQERSTKSLSATRERRYTIVQEGSSMKVKLQPIEERLVELLLSLEILACEAVRGDFDRIPLDKETTERNFALAYRM